MIKKLNALFLLIITVLLIACTAHTAIAYLNILNDKFTSFPASAALLLIIPYALTIGLLVITGIVLNKIHKNKKNK